MIENILKRIICSIEGSGCQFALIHQSLDIKDMISGDIDIVLDRHPDAVMLPIISHLIEAGEVKLIQNLHYEISHGHYYILQILGVENCFLHLDCLYDEAGVNRYHLKTSELLQGAVKTDWLIQTSPIVESIYLLMKRTIKGSIDSERLIYLQKILQQHKQELDPIIKQWYGDEGEQKIQELLVADSEQAKPILKHLRLILERRFKLNHSYRFLLSIVWTKYRQLKRFFTPSGFFVVILGPDGCGKSTVTDALSLELQRGYRKIRQFHWRPGLLPKLGRNSGNSNVQEVSPDLAPPTVSKYKGGISLIRFVYYWLDFVLGYWLKIYPIKAQTTLVIGERYFPDVLVNPARYGFDVPRWMMRLAAKWVPQADMVILLEDDPVAINARKDELTVEKIAELLAKYKQELSHWKNPVVINTSKGIDDVVFQVKNIILDETARQTKSRMSENQKWLAFPSAKNPKLWVDSRSSFSTAFNLYHPYSTVGKVVKIATELLPCSFIRSLFSSQSGAVENQLLNNRMDYIRSIMQQPDVMINYSTGTPGAHRKTTAQVVSKDKAIAYVKIAEKPVSILLANEARILNALKALHIEGVVIPQLIDFSENSDERYLFQTANNQQGRQRGVEIDSADLGFLTALSEYGQRSVTIDALFVDYGYQSKLDDLQNNSNYQDLWQQAKEIIDQQLGDAGVRCAYSHGDYAPWNTLLLENGDLYVFDWEYGNDVSPVLVDCMHRLLMPARLVAKQGSALCIQQLLSLWDKALFKTFINTLNIPKKHAPAYILLYLIELASRESESSTGVSDFVIECLVQILRHAKHPKHKRKVLVGAYACEPDQGSEPGVGWHWVEEISREHDAWVITKKNNRESIERQLAESPNANLHFEYVEVPKWASFWKKKQRGVRTYYYLWQFAALFKAKQLNQSVDFDLGHHVTFVNDWLWTFFALMPLPYIWGPIGSHPKAPAKLLPDAQSRKFDRLRFSFQVMMRCIDPFYWLSMFRASKILAINKQTALVFPLRPFAKDKIEVHPAIAVEPFNDLPAVKKTGDKFRVLFVGRFIPIKGAHLAIDAFALLVKQQPDCIFTLVGKGAELTRLKQQVKSHGLQDKIEFIDWLPRDQAITLMAQADVFLFPSMEGGGMVVLEAMALSVPVVCLDFGGPAAVVDESCGFKVEIGRQQATVEALAKALIQLKTDEQLQVRLAAGALKKVQLEMLWQAKSVLSSEKYSEITGK